MFEDWPAVDLPLRRVDDAFACFLAPARLHAAPEPAELAFAPFPADALPPEELAFLLVSAPVALVSAALDEVAELFEALGHRTNQSQLGGHGQHGQHAQRGAAPGASATGGPTATRDLRPGHSYTVASGWHVFSMLRRTLLAFERHSYLHGRGCTPHHAPGTP